MPGLEGVFALRSARVGCIQPVTGETVNIVVAVPGGVEKLLCV